MPNFVTGLLIFYKYIVSMNENNSAHWAATIKTGPLTLAFSTGLSILIIKALVSREAHCFGNKRVNLNLTIFLPILILEQ